MAQISPTNNLQVEEPIDPNFSRRLKCNSYRDVAARMGNNDEIVHSPECLKSVGILLNFLHENMASLKHQGEALHRFEELTIKHIPIISSDSMVFSILKEVGWVGSRYQYTSEHPIDVESMQRQLATIYLSRSTVEFTDDNSVIKSFCPDTLLMCHEKGLLSDMKSASNIDFYGTCMLVDISGFTKLSAALCTKGSSGLDDLHKAISGYLGKCVEIVYSHGGDVISFAGDALICIFAHSEAWNVVEGPDSLGLDSRSCEKAEADKKFSPNSVAALICAMELKEHCTDTLTCHVALSCGKMSLATFGGFHNEWVYMVVGSCINEISSCIDDAKSKEVVVTNSVYRAVMSELENVEALDTYVMPSGNMFIKELALVPTHRSLKRVVAMDSNAGDVNVMKLFVPLPVLDSLQTKNFKNSSQLREVTTMFVALNSFDPETMVENIPVLQQFFVMAQAVLAEAGGFMRQFLIDDKGCVLIAMWGVPSFTHPNNCSRSIYAAACIAVKAREMDHKVSIGITTGGVFCGTVGSAARRDYVGIGSKVNMSARLMSKAKGRVLMDVETYQHLPLDSRKALVLSEPFQLKGLEGDTYAYVCPVDGDNAPTLINLDDEDGKNNIVRLQKNIASVITVQLNKLANCLQEHFEDNKNNILHEGEGNGLVVLGDNKRSGSYFNKLRGGSFLAGMLMSDADSTSKSFSVAMEPPGRGINDTLESCVSITVVQGPAGSGKTTAANCFRRGAITRGLRVVYLQAQSGDENVPYGIIGKLIVELIGQDDLHNELKQRNTLKKLIHRIFPEADPVAKLKKSRSLKLAMGYKWMGADGLPPRGVSTKKQNPVENEGSDAPKPSRSLSMGQFSIMNAFKRRQGSMSVDDEWSMNYTIKSGQKTLRRREQLLTKLLTLLLQETPTAIAITNAHFADELSWQELKKIVDLPLQVAVLLTLLTKPASVKENAESVGPETKKGSGAMREMEKKAANHETIRYASNTSVYHIKEHPMCNVLDMVPFGYQEVHYILTNALIVGKKRSNPSGGNGENGVISQQITPEVVETVLAVSNGNAFWCKSIAEFIVERGVADFMRSVEAAHEGGTDNNKSDKMYGSTHQAGAPSMHGTIAHRGSIIDLASGTSGDGPLNQNPLYVLVVCRLEKLTSFLQVVIKYASIIGSLFDSLTLSAVLPKAFSVNLNKSLEVLLESSFILTVSSDGVSTTYTFQNYLIRNALYDLTPPREAAKIHEAIAHYIETTYTEELLPYYGSLSYHYALAGNQQAKAFRYAVEAGDEAISRGAHTDALVYCRKAIELVDNMKNCRVLMNIIDNAIEIIRPSGVVADMVRRMRKASVVSAAMRPDVENQLNYLTRRGSFDSNGLLTSYVTIKEELQTIMLEFDESTIVKQRNSSDDCCGCWPHLSGGVP